MASNSPFPNDFFAKRVTFHIPGQHEFCFEGSSSDTPVQLISIMKAQSLLKKCCQGYLDYVVGNDKDVKLDDIPIVRDYPDVFPEELPRLPPKSEVEFTIELMPGMTPILKAPYRMVSLELKDLKAQLQECLIEVY